MGAKFSLECTTFFNCFRRKFIIIYPGYLFVWYSLVSYLMCGVSIKLEKISMSWMFMACLTNTRMKPKQITMTIK